MEINTEYMRRALALAAHGMGHVSPNPMVGAVITNSAGQIIGEGYHRQWGGPHAEVNAINSVADRSHLRDSTMYVTLEPCAHYGKTPPCAKLIIDCKIPRVIVGSADPNPLVAGRGISMLREAGVEVVDGILAEECRRLNARFMTAQSLRRPFITLKWAQSSDGYIDSVRTQSHPTAFRFSTPQSAMEVHRLRALHDAILVGSGTVLADNPTLNTRLWHGQSPRPVILDRRHRIDRQYKVVNENVRALIVNDYSTLDSLMHRLFADEGISSLLVEGGSAVLQSFIDVGLWDIARIESSPAILGPSGATKAPIISAMPKKCYNIGKNTVSFYSQNMLFDVKNL